MARKTDSDQVHELLLQALEELARGCHEFHPRQKQHRFGEARVIPAAPTPAATP